MSPLFAYGDLELPIVGAPMAGGPSTPALAAAVSESGGLGCLAAGYLGVDRLAEDITAFRAMSSRPFGVNIFVPEERESDAAAVASYARALQPLASDWGVDAPESVPDSDDAFAEKIDLVVAERVPAVSFTFGCPEAEVIQRLHAAGCAVTVTVTSAADAEVAARAGADALCVQGTSAGGHRSTFTVAAEPNGLEAIELLPSVREVVDLPLVAAGGVSGRADVETLIEAGAVAVQVGTLLLRTPEAGTKAAHRAALADPRFAETAVTRAFSGRPARGLRNAFIDRFDAAAPAEYPQLNTMTGPLRRAAADDPDVLNLWAGTGFGSASDAPAAEVVRELAGVQPRGRGVG